MGCCFGTPRQSKETELPEVPAGYGKKQKVLAHQQKHWAATGVVSLRDSRLKELPPGLQDLAEVVKVIDVSSNVLESLPAVLSEMLKLERLIASGNRISSAHCQMSNWRKLKVMDLSGNRLSAFPLDVLQCPMLEILKLSDNQLTELPAAIEQCPRLKELHMASNHLDSLPVELGKCTGLEHVDCSSNQLTGLPEELGNLKKLRRLVLNNNQQLRTVPSAVLQGCNLLHTLELHSTLVSREVLQGITGYEGFERRRQNKFSKAIDGNAMIKQGGVDEGVDVNLMS
eukprot:jgi/Ulvmu1/4556/UM002_0284.1